jgi:iron(III) transport system ATP-binding protein
MDKGYMMQIGTPFEIYSRPSNRFVADFIGRVNLLPVRLEREDSGKYFVKDEGGMHFEAMSAVPGLKSGQEALFMLRPESLSVESEESASASEPERMILARGIVDKAVYLGSTVEYEIDVSLDRPMLAVSHDPVNVGFWKPGDSVILRYSPRAAHLLPLGSP